MRLVDLEPNFERIVESGKTYACVDTLAEAQGICFTCPCGKHSILAWFRGVGVPDTETPGPGRWTASGTNFDDLTLRPSINLPCWHGYVTDGAIK